MHIRNVTLAILVCAIAAFAQNPITTDSPFQIRYFANLNLGGSYINMINTGANGASLLGPGFGPEVGNICVNVYAFDPAEELISCCACSLTPNQVANLDVAADITSNTLTGAQPQSVVVKLLATLPVNTVPARPVGSACNAGTASNAVQAKGLLAYGTTLHKLSPTTSTVFGTETPFSPATLSPSELASITFRCTNIIANGSSFGICRSCRFGAQ